MQFNCWAVNMKRSINTMIHGNRCGSNWSLWLWPFIRFKLWNRDNFIGRRFWNSVAKINATISHAYLIKVNGFPFLNSEPICVCREKGPKIQSIFQLFFRMSVLRTLTLLTIGATVALAQRRLALPDPRSCANRKYS